MMRWGVPPPPKFGAEARRRGVRADEMASQILANVVADKLFLAVLNH
jgi:hypothetical protein